LNVPGGAFPDGHGAGEEGFALAGEMKEAAAAVGGVDGEHEEAAAGEGLEGSGESGAIHTEEIGHCGHTGWVGAIEGHEQGKLTVGEVDGTKCFVEATS
jgi:hypothetical protein